MSLAQKQFKFNVENISCRKFRAEFSEKNALLRASYPEIPAFDFYDYLYQGDQAPKVYALERKTFRTARPDDMPMIAAFRSDFYVPPCAFFNGAYNKRCLAKIYALVLDIDYIDPDSLDRLINRITDRELPQPSLIVNSGSGIHLYFSFDDAADAYKRRLPALRAILDKLADIYEGYGKMDRHPLTQSFRPPGSQTKLGQVATGFVCGGRWTVDQLAALCNVELGGVFGPVEKTDKTATAAPKKKKAAAIAYMPNAKKKFFRYCAERVFKYTDLGGRYMALFGLAIVGYKTHTPKEEVIAEMQSLVKIWNRRHPENPVEMREIDKALDGYSQKFLMVRSSTLEEYFGWSFERKIPRRGQTRADHLEIARAVKDAKVPLQKKQAISNYLKKHIATTVTEIAQALKISRTTVIKYTSRENGAIIMKK